MRCEYTRNMHEICVAANSFDCVVILTREQREAIIDAESHFLFQMIVPISSF